MLTRYWDVRITKTAKRHAGAANVDPRTFKAAVQAFEDLRYSKSPTTRYDVDAIVSTGGRLFRHRTSRPLYLLHYRSIFTIVRERRDDGKRGTLLLCAVLPRDPNTYDPKRLQQIVQDLIAEVKREEALA